MSLLGTISRQDRGTAPVLPNLEAPPESTGFFQNIGAGFTQSVAGPHSTRNAKAIYESRQYDQIISALKAEGEQATDMVPSPVLKSSPFYRPVEGEQDLPDGRVLIPVKRDFSNPFSEGPSLTRDVNPIGNFYLGGDAAEQKQIWDAVNKVRARKPDFLKAFGDQNAVDAHAQQQRQADEAKAGDVTSRATTLGKVGSFIGGVAGSVASGDPENFVGGWAGAPGKTFARTIVKRAVEGAATNTAAGIVAVPGQATDAQGMGQPMTTSDMLQSVGETAAAGALLGGVHAAIPHVPGAVSSVTGQAFDTVAAHLPDGVRDPVAAAALRAGTVKDRQLLYEFQRAHNPYSIADTSTPSEKAAAHVIVNDVETQEQSPFHPEAAASNNNRLGAVAKALGVDLTPPELPTTAPTQVPTVRDQANGGRKPASFVDGINAAEGKTRNPRSTADGYGNFLESTWLSVAPHVTDTAGMSRDQILALRHDKGIAGKATEYYAAQNGQYLRSRGIEDSPGNLSLAHFLGAGDAAKVLKADPATPVESLLSPEVVHANHEVLQGKSADQVIAWAHKRIGAAVDHPPARPDAVPDEGFDYSAPVPYLAETLRPDDVSLDPAAMQYKSGGDENGVTDALKGVEQWNPLLSQQILTWEPNEGGRVVVDGHQRVALAKRLGGDIDLPAITVREADGVTARDARVLGALRNIANGTGTLIDNAKVLRDVPDAARLLPANGPLTHDSVGLSHLSYDAFGAAVNEVVDPRVAAQVGLNAAGHPEAHMPILGLLRKEKISDPREAAAITRQALADGFGTADAQQLSLLGNEPQQALYKPIARIMSAAAKRLREEKRTFKVLTEKSSKIEAEGNVLDRTRNESKVIGNDEALAILERTAHRSGPVRDALIRAAKSELSGSRRTDAVDQFIGELGRIDLRAAAGEGSGDSSTGGSPVEQGRDEPAEASDENLSGRGQPSLFDRAVSARDQAEKFSEPANPEALKHADLIEHDLRQDAGLPPKGAENADTRGHDRIFHGARGEVPQLSEGYYNPDNIYGGFDTFYTTDALDIARGYQRKRSSGRVYEVHERQPVNHFDMEARHPESYWNELFGLRGDEEGLVPVAIEEAAYEQGGQHPNLREIMDEIRNFSAGEGYSKDDVQEVFDTAIHNLKQRGFGGMTHIGGLKTGRMPHKVRIYFDAPSQLDLKEMHFPKEEANGETQRSTDNSAQVDNQQSESGAGTQGESQSGTGKAGPTVEPPVHLFDLPSTEFRLSEEGNTISLKQAIENADADEAAAKALRDCL